MKKDDWILLGFPAANCDPAVFAKADEFIHRSRGQPSTPAFGLGIHRLRGRTLARLELRVAPLRSFLKRYQKFELESFE